MLESILHQLGARLDAKVSHDRVFVKGYRALGHMEEIGNFLHCAAFREKLRRSALAALAVNNFPELFKPPETTRSNHQRAFNAAAKQLTSTKKQESSPRFRRKINLCVEKTERLTTILCSIAPDYPTTTPSKPWRLSPVAGGLVPTNAAVVGHTSMWNIISSLLLWRRKFSIRELEQGDCHRVTSINKLLP